MSNYSETALLAYKNGDIALARQSLLDAGDQILGDTVGLQILALTSAEPVEENVLLQQAAYEAVTGSGEPFFNLAVLEQKKGKHERALLLYQQALRIDPSHLGSLNNASDLLRRKGRGTQAWKLLTRYLAEGGDTDGLEIRFAKIADDCGCIDEARAWFAKAIDRQPNSHSLAWERAMQQLRDEEFEAGWVGYEARKLIYDHQALGIVSYCAPEWSRQSLGEKSLLIHKEQGLGDTIMFASLLSALPADPQTLHLAVQPQLTRLFALNFPKAQVWTSVSTPERATEDFQPWRQLAEPIDYQLPFGSLPFALRHNQRQEPLPYLRPCAEDHLVWDKRLGLLAPDAAQKVRAGLVISARRDVAQASGLAEGGPKSVSGHLLWPLDLAGVAWFGLHDKTSGDDLADVPITGIIDTSPWLHDLADTAALIANLDVVVAVDTAVAHLAGAMGKKVLLMLRHNADWRWGRDRCDSYWYCDVEVFRQRHEGDWSPVIAQIASRISELAEDIQAGAKP